MTSSNAQAGNTKHKLLNNLGSKRSPVMKFYEKILRKMWPGNFLKPIFKEPSVKKILWRSAY